MLVARLRWPDGVVPATEHDGRNGDQRLARHGCLGRLVSRVPAGQAEAVPVGMDDHVHEVRVVERRSGLSELAIGERPGRRPLTPQQAGVLGPIGPQTELRGRRASSTGTTDAAPGCWTRRADTGLMTLSGSALPARDGPVEISMMTTARQARLKRRAGHRVAGPCGPGRSPAAPPRRRGQTR